MYPTEVFGDRPRLVALDRPDEMPHQRQIAQRRLFFQRLLHIIIAEFALAAGGQIAHRRRAEGLADGQQAYLRRAAPGFGRSLRETRLHGPQTGACRAVAWRHVRIKFACCWAVIHNVYYLPKPNPNTEPVTRGYLRTAGFCRQEQGVRLTPLWKLCADV